METIIFSTNQNLHEVQSYKIAKYIKDHIHNNFEIAANEVKEASFFLAEWLHEQYAEKEILDVLRMSFDFLSPNETYKVKQLAQKHLINERILYIKKIQRKLLEFTEISRKINLDGFWCFVMRDYRSDILNLLEESLDEYWAEEDYREFLDLLHCFIEIEESQIETLLIQVTPDGKYHYFDENNQDITTECEELMRREFSDVEDDENVQQNDMLISLLVILIPEKIIISGVDYMKDKNFLTTLQIVFANRIHYLEEYAGI